ncbi:MAG: hypothetical protein A2Z65_12955 [Gallionellales bacterium RIFCSPLOWO2_02_58_13]|nr:MAG: hypothetical protein A2Z65_12955 [Gallionellales bacterium RIFCSPLOWO2_02_58_13]
MLQAIDDYQSKSLGISQLISDLEGLHNFLDHPDENWINNFYQYWMPLEEIYAVALDRKQSEFDEHSQTIIGQSLGKLKELIVSKLPR